MFVCLFVLSVATYIAVSVKDILMMHVATLIM